MSRGLFTDEEEFKVGCCIGTVYGKGGGHFGIRGRVNYGDQTA